MKIDVDMILQEEIYQLMNKLVNMFGLKCKFCGAIFKQKDEQIHLTNCRADCRHYSQNFLSKFITEHEENCSKKILLFVTDVEKRNDGNSTDIR